MDLDDEFKDQQQESIPLNNSFNNEEIEQVEEEKEESK
jgi:hypothetical protein